MDDLVGLTVGQVLSQYGLDYAALELIDEPPGRLWGVAITPRQGSGPVRLVLEIESHSGLFSKDRKWPQELVERQKVARVHTSSKSQF